MIAETHFFSKTQRIIAAKLCFFIFFTKMLISMTPIFVDVLDRGTVLQVVMQLEIENTAKGNNSNNEDLHEHSIKIFKPDAMDFLSFNPTVENTGRTKHYLKNERTICAFHPRVPTPPPNA
ncbi:hypothetical protein [Sphingobacterium sp. UBA6645]|uniref:Uncharacterized protein n=2 Tax=Sphingobacterium hotanense TaxID=649196 RepID=A0ABT7NT98_9SPHI|nr:hypothetical protein [Sphingobacterium sp. UBA6645]MDM1050469.1 hypothetical protein [Sphingobacterium hotanense]